MEKEINEVFHRFSSRVPFLREVKRGEDITVVAGGQTYIFNCTKRQELDRQDGSYDLIQKE